MPELTFITLLNQAGNQDQFARQVIIDLLANKRYKYFGTDFSYGEIITALRGWAAASFTQEQLEQLTGEQQLNPKAQAFLYQLYLLVSNRLAITKQGNIPTLQQLQEWQSKLQEHEAWLEKIQQTGTQSKLLTLEKLNLDQQLTIISSYQNFLSAETGTLLAAYLPEELKQQVQEKISQAYTREAVALQKPLDPDTAWRLVEKLCEQDYQVAVALTGSKRIELAKRLTSVNQQKPEITIQALTQAQQSITQAHQVLAPSREELKVIVQQKLGCNAKQSEEIVCRLEINLPKTAAPLEADVRQAVDRSLSFVDRANLKRKGLTEKEVLDSLTAPAHSYYQALPLMQQGQGWNTRGVSARAADVTGWLNPKAKPSLALPLPLIEPVAVEHLLRGGTVQTILQDLTKRNQVYQQQLTAVFGSLFPASQWQQVLTKLNLGPSITTFSHIAESIASGQLKLDSFAQAVTGVFSTQAKQRSLLARLELTLTYEQLVKIDQAQLPEIVRQKLIQSLQPSVEQQTLESFKTQVQEAEKRIDKLPFYRRSPLKAQLGWRRYKAKTRGLLEELNPFGLKFYEKRFSGLTKSLTTKAEFVKTRWQHLKKNTPLGWLIAPFAKVQDLRYRFLGLRVKQWEKLVDKISNPALKRFFNFIPKLGQPGYLAQLPYRLARKWGGQALVKLGTRLGKKALGFLLQKAGETLLKEGFKQLLTKGLAYGLGILAGSAIPGIGNLAAIIIAVIDFGIKAVRFVFSRRGRELIGKLLKPAAAGLGVILLYILKLLGHWPLTIGGATIGFAIAGPAGMVVGGFIGFVLDNIVHGFDAFVNNIRSFFGAGAGSTAAAGPAAAMAPKVLAAPLSPTNLLANLGPAHAALAAPAIVAGLTAATIITQSSASIVPPPPDHGDEAYVETMQPPWESQYQMIEKVPDKPNLSNNELPNTITYTVTITPKQNGLTIQDIKDEVTITSRTTGAPTPTITRKPGFTSGMAMVNNPTVFTYEMVVTGSHKDSLITNTVTVTSHLPDGTPDIVTGQATVTIGNPPSVDCPLHQENNPYISYASYGNTIGSGHHGSNAYWNNLGGDDCYFKIPVTDDCYGPQARDPDGSPNMCSTKAQCAVYGFAMDVHAAGGTPVYLPGINGGQANWQYVRWSSGLPDTGHGHIYTATVGVNTYLLQIYHMVEGKGQQLCLGTCPSGTRIGTVFGDGINHIHIEIAINDQWRRPEEVMCKNLSP